jgi:hypothetical protein
MQKIKKENSGVPKMYLDELSKKSDEGSKKASGVPKMLR